AARLVELEHEALVDRAGRLEQLELLVERRQDLGGGSGTHHLGRMTVEGQHRRRQSARPRKIAHEPQHGLVSQMYAVEGADGDRATADGSADLVRIAPDDHPGSWHSGSWRFDSCGASTTAGFTPAPRRS